MKSKLDNPIFISITGGAIVKAVAILLLFYLLYIIRDLVLVVITSVVIASAIEPGTRFFVSKKIPRILSVLMIYMSVALVFIGIFAIFLPPLLGDLSDLGQRIPTYVEAISNNELSSLPGLSNIVSDFVSQKTSADILDQIESFGGATFGFLTTASSIFGGLLSFVLIIVISFYLSVQENGVENFIRIVTPVEHEKYVLDLWKRSQRKIGLWMQGQLLLAVIVGLLTYLGLSILGVRNPIFLALIAAMFELIPVFGPILAGIPAVAFGLIDGGVTLGLLVAALYIIIQQFESQLIHPLVVRKIVGIPALLAIIALIVGAQIAGFLGIIISVPITAAIMEYINDVEKRKKSHQEALKGK